MQRDRPNRRQQMADPLTRVSVWPRRVPNQADFQPPSARALIRWVALFRDLGEWSGILFPGLAPLVLGESRSAYCRRLPVCEESTPIELPSACSRRDVIAAGCDGSRRRSSGCKPQGDSRTIP